jgi:nucleoid-associated protein YgaU
MFTAMLRRPLVWLLALLAPVGIGWLVYERAGQDARQPIVESAGPQPEAEQAATQPAPQTDPRTIGVPETTPPGSAGAPVPPADVAEREAPAASAPGEAAGLSTEGRAAPAVDSGRPASPPASAEPPGLQTPDPGRAAGGESAVAEAAPALAPKAEVSTPAAAQSATASGQASPAVNQPGAADVSPSETLPQDEARPDPPAVVVPPARGARAATDAPAAAPARSPPITSEGDIDWARLRELAPAADAPQPPAAGSPSSAPARPAARTEPAPERLAAGSDRAGSTDTPTEVARLAPETAVIKPGPPPTAGAPAIERPSAVPRVLNSIRRALAALLGGSPDPTEPTLPGATVIEEPATSDLGGAPPDGDSVAASPPREMAAAAPEPVRPSFDIVRVERDGRAVVAGRAAPGAEVELRAGERVIDRVQASRRGEWVATPLEPLPPGGQELSVAALSAGAPALEGQQIVVVAVPEPPPPQPAEVALAAKPAEPVAILLPKDGQGGGRILQAPGRISSDGGLALLVLDYDDSGRIRLTGEAPPGAPVRIYVDNRPSSEVVVEPSGRWSAVLEHKLAPGDYTLRLDQIGSQGRPVARLETPFTRVRQPPVAGTTQVDYVVVQPGNSLWRIARRLFGSGFKYVLIYDANQAQIRDPDLIYPGQVFEIPPAVGTAG